MKIRRRWKRRSVSIALAAGTLGACTETESPVSPPVVAGSMDEPAPDVGAEAAPPPTSLSFAACPGAFSGACATIEVPLDWSAPDGKKIGVFIDKIASSSKPKRQLWLLQGGPGGTAAGMVPLGLELASRLEDAEVFTIEHRGVGYSNRLGCTDFEAKHASDGVPAQNPGTADGGTADGGTAGGPPDLIPCFEEIKTKHGDDLRFYTVTNAARDLARAIELTRRADVPVFVFGVSYGTYWAQRFMQIAPTSAAGVVLDSVVPPVGLPLSRFDLYVDPVAIKLSELCKEDPTCSAALGPDPWARLQEIKAKLDAGHCSDAGLVPRERPRLTQLVQTRMLAGYAFALMHRLDRCTPEDVTAVKTFLSKPLFEDPTESLGSSGLFANVAFSELWESPPPSPEVMAERFDAAVFPSGIVETASIHPIWPKYPPDEYVGKYPTTDIPVLVLAGTFDAQTPIEAQELVKPHYTARHQTFVTVPTASHGVVGQSPMLAALPGAPPRSCGLQIAVSFLKGPTEPPDTSCTAQIAPIDFTRPPEEVGFILGTTDMWLGATPASEPSPPWLAFAPVPPRPWLFGR